MSGYDIKQLVDISLSYFWNISYGQIYPILKKLESEGLARSTPERTQGGRPRNLFSITRKGKMALDEWLQEPVDLSIQRDEMQLKLFIGGHTDRPRMVALIQDFQVQQESRLRTLEAELEEILPSIRTGILPEDLEWLGPIGPTAERRRQIVKDQALVFKLSIRQGILKVEARLAWCKEALEALNQEVPC